MGDPHVTVDRADRTGDAPSTPPAAATAGTATAGTATGATATAGTAADAATPDAATAGTATGATVAVRGDVSDEVVAAIVAAIEVTWPRPAVVPPAEAPRWRFSGRWWTKPVPLRRARPW